MRFGLFATALTYVLCAGFLHSAPALGACARGIDAESFSTADFRRAVDRWVGELSQVAAEAPGPLTWPPSMSYSLSRRERAHNVEAAIRLKYPLLEAMSHQFAELSGSYRSNPSLQELTERLKNDIYRRYLVSAYSRPDVDRHLAALEGTWDELRTGLPLEGFNISHFVDLAARYAAEVEGLRKKYGDDLITDQVVVGAGFGNLASQVIADSMGAAPQSTRALAALSLLHPLTDDALDQGADVWRAMAKITAALRGEQPEAENRYERVVLSLIGDIFADFPAAQHPVLVTILQDLHKAQLESVRVQKSKGAVAREALVELSIRKGGLTALAMAYCTLGRLTGAETEFFFKAGIMFQLSDDLLDLTEDERDGVVTLWTKAPNRREFQATFRMYARIQEYLEREGASLLATNANRSAILNDLKFGFKFYLLGAYLNPEVRRRLGPLLDDKFPLSPENTRSMIFALHEAIKETPGGNPDLLATLDLFGGVFDHHILKGQFAAFAAANAGRSPASIYRIRGAGLRGPFVRLANAMEWFTSRLYHENTFLGKAKQQVLLWSLALYHINAWLHLPRMEQRAGVMFVAFASWASVDDNTKRPYAWPLLSIFLSAMEIYRHLQ